MYLPCGMRRKKSIMRKAGSYLHLRTAKGCGWRDEGQSMMGKAPMGVAKLGKKYNNPAIGVVGISDMLLIGFISIHRNPPSWIMGKGGSAFCYITSFVSALYIVKKTDAIERANKII